MLDKTDFLNLPNEREALIKDSIWVHLKFLSNVNLIMLSKVLRLP